MISFTEKCSDARSLRDSFTVLIVFKFRINLSPCGRHRYTSLPAFVLLM